jgi:hypothetical protein
LAVAYMLSLRAKRTDGVGERRRKPVNPQSQRLWDAIQLADEKAHFREPTFSPNLVPLTFRARAFERRLKLAIPGVATFETSIPHLLEAIEPFLNGCPTELRIRYKRFEEGRSVRDAILKAMEQLEWLVGGSPSQQDLRAKVGASVENFHAFLAAWVSALKAWGLTNPRPSGFVDQESWVYLPGSAALTSSQLR